MARFSDENSVKALNGASKEKKIQFQEVRKEVTYKSIQDKPAVHNEAFMLIVEVAKCLVTETCLQASHQALSAINDRNVEHSKEYMSHDVLDYP
ncbi:uncharacterized protein [Epargyreus clarus]|uniref:uncharacterized protein n=1 Tax=Epargyreus clarus TaxID=520877 RepID=UPI003C2FBD6D